jgi:hypothetical protein
MRRHRYPSNENHRPVTVLRPEVRGHEDIRTDADRSDNSFVTIADSQPGDIERPPLKNRGHRRRPTVAPITFVNLLLGEDGTVCIATVCTVCTAPQPRTQQRHRRHHPITSSPLGRPIT